MLENKIRKFVLRKGLLQGSPFLFSEIGQFILPGACFVYILLRAIKIPITHDEAGTILNFSTQSVWNIISYQDPIPNNHLLNTLLIKLSTTLFGFNALSCRLPNIVAGLIFLLTSYKISYILFKMALLRFVFQILMISNPYVIEFFSLARGYGLSISLMTLSLYFLLLETERKILLAILFGALATYANITQLNYLIPLLAIILYWSVSQRFLTRTFILKSLSILLIMSGLLVIPILKMIRTNQFSYWGNSGFWNETFLPLLKSSVQGEGYFSGMTTTIFILVIVLSLLYSVLKLMYRWCGNEDNISNSLILNFVFFGAIVYNVAQHYMFDIPYLNARTAIFFYPLYILAVSSNITGLNNKKFNKGMIIYALFGVFGLLHISRTYNLHSSYEWWYDGDNKKVIDKLERSRTEKPVSFKCNWLFQPSLTYYIKAEKHNKILPPPYQKSIDTSELVDYYYITSDDLNDWFRQNYIVDTSYAWNSRYLMKKK